MSNPNLPDGFFFVLVKDWPAGRRFFVCKDPKPAGYSKSTSTSTSIPIYLIEPVSSINDGPPVDQTASDRTSARPILAIKRVNARPTPATEPAIEFLKQYLAAGPQPVALERARQIGINEKAIRRARAHLGVITYRLGGTFNGPWYWKLPDPA
jgi:hypothetical protein